MTFEIQLHAENNLYGIYRNAKTRLHKRSIEPYNFFNFFQAILVKKIVATFTKLSKTYQNVRSTGPPKSCSDCKHFQRFLQNFSNINLPLLLL